MVAEDTKVVIMDAGWGVENVDCKSSAGVLLNKYELLLMCYLH